MPVPSRCRLALSVVLAGAVVGCGDDGVSPPLPEVTDPLVWIDPRIGAGGLAYTYGSAFVGAAVPHGLTKVGPDTDGPYGLVPFQHVSGYWAGDTLVRSFTHLHLHGAGIQDYGVLGVLPVRAFDPAVVTSERGYELPLAAEDARPGVYRCTADGVAVELAATPHGAAERFDFGGGGGGWIVVDVARTLGGVIDDATVAVDDVAGEVTGRIHQSSGMTGNYGGYDLYFVVRARTAWAEHQDWRSGTGEAFRAGTALRFASGPVELQVAVSLVSADGARANLDAELPAWDQAGTVAAAEAAWRAVTGTVLVTGGSTVERRLFYTGLYHAFLMPSVISDVDGRYRLAGVADPLTTAGRQLSDLSLWDTYRTVQPLYDWLVPPSGRDSARSLAAFGAGTGAVPRWPIAIGESGTMLGASAEIVIGDAVAKGVIDIADAGWPLLRAEALDPAPPPGGRGERAGVELYMQYGYVPSSQGRSVSTTTEFAHDDFALAAIAAAAGASDDADALMARRLGWRQLFDPSVGFLRARGIDGSFAAGDFDPTELTDDYAEANAWHSLWMAGAHDPDGLAGLFGGRAGAVTKLVELFTLSRTDWETGDEAAAYYPRKYYWHGNEPDLVAPVLFAQLGRPDLAQEWTRWVMTTQYADTPEGLAGNDDGGTLGAWYVWAALGLYPIPGSDRYVVLAPLFPRARILVEGRELVVEAPGADADHRFVAGVTVDGVPLAGPELRHAQLVAAHELRFELADAPTAWGQAP